MYSFNFPKLAFLCHWGFRGAFSKNRGGELEAASSGALPQSQARHRGPENVSSLMAPTIFILLGLHTWLTDHLSAILSESRSTVQESIQSAVDQVLERHHQAAQVINYNLGVYRPPPCAFHSATLVRS